MLNAYTLAHVLISLVGIVAGGVMAYGMATGRRFPRSTAVFLWTTLATSLTGFFFPFHGMTPALVVGAISIVLLLAALAAWYRHALAGSWRMTFVVTALVAQYLNVFVLIVQSFQKIPALHALAPTQKELPFTLAQAAVLALFVVLGVVSARRFRPV